MLMKKMIMKKLSGIKNKMVEEKVEDNEWLTIYAKGLSLLDDYDHEQLDAKGLTTRAASYPTLEAYFEVVNQMKSEFDSAVFGKEKDKSFQRQIIPILAEVLQNLRLYLEDTIIRHTQFFTNQLKRTYSSFAF